MPQPAGIGRTDFDHRISHLAPPLASEKPEFLFLPAAGMNVADLPDGSRHAP
jgi:hypothetical protein